MHMMFVDESGDPGYPQDGDWDRFGGTKVFIRLGLIIHGWKWKAWNKKLVNFKKNRQLIWDDEIKANHLRKGSGIFEGWDEPRRDQFRSDLSRLIGYNKDFTLISVVIDKTKIDRNKKDRLVKPEVSSLEHLLETYNLFLRHQEDKSGIVVLDPTIEKGNDNLRYFQSFLQNKSKFLKPLHIVEGTFFAKSHTSNMIQLADFCSNLHFRQVTLRDGSNDWKAIEPRFWTRGGTVKGFGIKIWPV